jgi:glycosyltransferase involved in cell wall biosynthesis
MSSFVKKLLWIFVWITCSLEATNPTICLNMIVKDESAAIIRCLESVKPFIDYWVIVDTGSTDGTQALIQKSMKDIPGELHERPWVNFGHNRQEALTLAKNKSDYLLFIDADEIIKGNFDKNALCKDGYMVNVRISHNPSVTFQRMLLINNHLNWSWQGVIHEKLNCDNPRIHVINLQGVTLSAEAKDGKRSQDPQKYKKDADTLEKALLIEPDNADYVYYLAQSYNNDGNFEKALENYQKRAGMTGWDQHTFWSKYYSGRLQESLNKDPSSFIKSYSEAFAFRQTRAEPLFYLAAYFLSEKNYLLAYLLAQEGIKIPLSTDSVYVENTVYSYGLLSIFAYAAAGLGRQQEAEEAWQRLLAIPEFTSQLPHYTIYPKN